MLVNFRNVDIYRSKKFLGARNLGARNLGYISQFYFFATNTKLLHMVNSVRAKLEGP